MAMMAVMDFLRIDNNSSNAAEEEAAPEAAVIRAQRPKVAAVKPKGVAEATPSDSHL
jgi:hypothetical protein